MKKLSQVVPRLHSILSPSSSHRWLGDDGEDGCGASIRLIGLYQQPDNEAMSEGTLAHSRLELLLKGKHPAGATGTNEDICNREMCEFTDAAADYCRNLRHSKGTLTAEGKLDLPQIAFAGVLDGQRVTDPGQGHADCIIDNPDAWHIVDFKYGYGPVEVEHNPQLLLYALACFKKKRKPCTLHIIQPRGGHSDGPTRSWTASVAYMAAFEKKVLAQVALINSGKAPFKPSGPVCKYCPKKGECKAFQEKALAVVNKGFEEFMDKPATFRKHALSDKQLAQAWLNWPLVEMFRDMLEAQMMARLKAGSKLPAKLVRGRTNAVWVDEGEVEAACKMVGLKPDRYAPRSLLSPSAMLKVFHGKAPLIEDLMVYPQGPIQIAPLSDKRKPIKLKGK